MQSADVKIIFPVVSDRSVMIPGNTIKATNFTNKMKTKPPEDIRRGKWTAEEEAYAIKLIEAFNGGLLALSEEEVANGLTLRAFLAQRLSCDPMRITKKFSGDYCLGKRNYHNAEYIDNQLLTNMRNSLIILEKSFKMKDVEIKKEKMYKEELERNKTHPVINYGHMVSSPAIDAMVLKTVPTGLSQSDSAQVDTDHIHDDQSQGAFVNMQNTWGGETNNFARENEMKNNNCATLIRPVQIVQEYGYFYDIPAPQQDPSVTLAANGQYEKSKVNNQGVPFPSVTNNFNHGNTIGLNSPIDIEFTNGYGNIDFPVEFNLVPTDSGQSQTVIIKNESQMSIGLASNFSFSFDSTLGFSFMSTASLTSGLFPSTASLTGIMNAFSGEDANDSITNAVVMDTVASVDNDDGVAPCPEHTKKTTTTNDDHLHELSYNLSRSVSIKGELNTNSDGGGVGGIEKRINMLTKAGKGSASFETSSDTASTYSSSSTTSSKPHYLSQEPTPAAASTATSRSGLTPQSASLTSLTSSGPPVFAFDALLGPSNLSVTESIPMSTSTTRFSSLSTASASSWKAGSLASVKRNRSVNERLNLDVPSVATSTETTALPLKMRRTTSASGLQVRDIDSNTSGRRAVYISLLHHRDKVGGVVRRSVSCSVLYDTWSDRRRGGRSSKNMLRSKSHNIVISKDIELVVEEEEEEGDDGYSRNEVTSAICI